MRKLVIAVDCDDVLVKTTHFFVQAYNQVYGTDVALEKAHQQVFDHWGADEDEVNRRFAKLMETEEYKSLGPDTEEAKVLVRLAKTHSLHLVTARSERERKYTQALLDRRLGGVFQSMEFVGWFGSKGDICRKIKADMMIDDNYAYLQDAIEKGLPSEGALLFGDYPWQPKSVEDIIRCKDWREVEDAVERTATK